MREDQERMNPKCEYAILLNSEKFIKENNLKLKDKTKETNITNNLAHTNSIPMTRNLQAPQQSNHLQTTQFNRRNNLNNANAT